MSTEKLDALEKKLKRLEQRKNRYQQKISYTKSKQRKLETRRKIGLGGLIVKAEIDNWTISELLGLLLTGKQDAENDRDLKKIFQARGDRAFMKYDD